MRQRERSARKGTYTCTECGYRTTGWLGRCPDCGGEGTLEPVSSGQTRGTSRPPTQHVHAQELQDVAWEEARRVPTSSAEVDRVLGGGLVSGSVTLLAGEPGIGKSTLLLQLAQAIAHAHGPILYVSGEESAQQIRLRSQRLGLSGRGVLVLCETDAESIIAQIRGSRPVLAVIDSIQTAAWAQLETHPGSVAQIRECTRLLIQCAKEDGVPVVLAGHVTKEGEVAGPRVLEHMVDVVLQLEGERVTALRLLRSAKNRYGSTSETGVFQMEGQGLIEVPDPSRVFLEERQPDAVGSVLVPTLEGSRPLLVEVQALTSPSIAPAPRRAANGVDYSRLLLITSVLAQRARLPLGSQDVIVSAAGGLRVSEPSADLGIALALASSLWNIPLPSDLGTVGELGLSAEVRRVPQLERRLAELARLGVGRCLVPASGINALDRGSVDVTPVAVANLQEALAVAFPGRRPGGTGRSAGDAGVGGALQPP